MSIEDNLIHICKTSVVLLETYQENMYIWRLFETSFCWYMYYWEKQLMWLCVYYGIELLMWWVFNTLGNFSTCLLLLVYIFLQNDMENLNIVLQYSLWVLYRILRCTGKRPLLSALDRGDKCSEHWMLPFKQDLLPSWVRYNRLRHTPIRTTSRECLMLIIRTVHRTWGNTYRNWIEKGETTP